MILKAEQQRLKSLLSETIILLCRNGLNFNNEISIEGLIGITLDQEDIFLVNIKESIVSVEEIYVEQVSRNVPCVSDALVSNSTIRIQEDIHVSKPVSFCDANSPSVNLDVIEDTSVADDSTNTTEATISRTRAVQPDDEKFQIRPMSRHDVVDVNGVISAAMSDTNVKNYNNFTLNVDLSSSGPRDRVSFSPQSRKRRRVMIAEKSQALSPVTIHETSPCGGSSRPPVPVSNNNSTRQHGNIGQGGAPSNSKTPVSNNNSTGHRGNISRSSHSKNIKIEKAGLVEIKDENCLSDREDLEQEEEDNNCYDEYDGVYGTGGSATQGDVYLSEEGRMLERGPGESRSVQSSQNLFDSHSNDGSSSRQKVDIGCFPEEHLTTGGSYYNEQFSDMSDLYTHKYFAKDTFARRKSLKGFHHQSTMRKHLPRVQSGERSFHCETCSKPFSTLFNLQRHELIHTGERPFGCNICNKRFTQLSTLRTHERIHWRETMLSYQPLETF